MVHINLSISYQITNHIEIEDGSHQFVHIKSNHKSHWNWGWFTSICPYLIKSQITLKLRMVHINLSISNQITNHIEIEDGSHQFVHILSNHKSHWNWGWFTSICPYLIKSQITLKLRMVHINLSISYQITNHIEIEDGSHQFVHILSNHKSHWNWGWFTSICPYLIKSQITLKLRMVHINLSISYQITNHIEIEDGSHQFVHILSNHKSHWNWGWFTSICPYQIKSQITLKLRMVHINLSISYQITNHIEIADGSHQFVHIKSNHKSHWNWGWFTSICPYLIKSQITLKLRMVHINLSISNHKSHWNWGWFTSICPYLIKSQITLKLRMVHINLSISNQITNHIEIEDGSHQFVHILSNHKSHWNWGWFTSICPYQIKSQITLKLRMVHINLSISNQITNHIEIEDGSHQFVHILSNHKSHWNWGWFTSICPYQIKSQITLKLRMVHINLSISYQITNHIEIEDGSHQFVHIKSNHKSHWNWGWFT